MSEERGPENDFKRLLTEAALLAEGAKPPRPNTSKPLSLAEYDHILVMFSGGKDSIACTLRVLHALRGAGLGPERVELWHQCIDGHPDGERDFMDWPVTVPYVRAFAEALGLPLLFQWKEGGFLREMERQNALTAPTAFQLRDGSTKTVGGKRGKPSTRRKFPQVSADLRVRWCSAYLKIDVAAAAINNDPRFKGKNVLVITGERWEESSARAGYPEVERHRCSNSKRRVDQWRPVLRYNEAMVWLTLWRGWRGKAVNAHPCYAFGYGRASCATCIFGGPDEWATMRELDPLFFKRIELKEVEYGLTIHRTRSIVEQANRGESHLDSEHKASASAYLMTPVYDLRVLVERELWGLPMGAFRHTKGPT